MYRRCGAPRPPLAEGFAPRRLVVAIGFLVVTQRQAFDATLSMAVGVSAAVPTLVKLTNLLTQLGVRTSGEGRQQNA